MSTLHGRTCAIFLQYTVKSPSMNGAKSSLFWRINSTAASRYVS